MIDSISFKNFKVLRDAQLKLRPFNIIVGPNGSGKSTVFKALELGKNPHNARLDSLKTVGVEANDVELRVKWVSGDIDFTSVDVWNSGGTRRTNLEGSNLNSPSLSKYQLGIAKLFGELQVYSLDPNKVAEKVQLLPNSQLARDGSNLAAALDNLRDESRASFHELELELNRWLPEFDSILFQTPNPGLRSFGLGQVVTQQLIRSHDLSEGTLLALALLYIVHNLRPVSVVCLEEPDRGLHPRLLRDLRDALYRLSYPDQFGIKREPIQVIATTHSPYFLDLFKDHPEEIIIAEKQPDATAVFKNLADDKELIEIIGDAPLGEVWYTGILGGVPLRK